jgi:hypothetical protein
MGHANERLPPGQDDHLVLTGDRTPWPDWDAPIDPPPVSATREAVRDAREAARRAERGRHVRGRRGPRRGGRPGAWPAGAQIATIALIVVAVLVPVGAVGLQLATSTGRQAGRAAEEPPAADVTPSTPAAVDPVGGATASNLLPNWSFERDLSGWQTVGGAELSRQVGGHTSGSSAMVRATGAGRVGIMAAGATARAPGGVRYAASAWVRGDTKGTPVTVCVFSTRNGRRTETDHQLRITGVGRWARLVVTHKVPAGGGDVGVEVLLTRGGAIVVDEVTLTRR